MNSFKSNPILYDDIKPNKLIYLVDYYLCTIIHNPLVSSGFILFSLGYFILTTSESTRSLIHGNVLGDILANLINLIAICRFVINLKFNSLTGEIFLFTLQLFTSYIILDTSNLSNILTICIYCQINLPCIIILINYYYYHIDFYDCFKSGNNNVIPFLLSYSILLMNNQLWFNSSIIQSIHSISILSLKFYLIYQYILHEYVSIKYDGLECIDYSIFYPNQKSINLSIIKNDNLIKNDKTELKWIIIKRKCLLSVTLISIIFDVYLYTS